MLVLDKITLNVAGRVLIENSSINIADKSKIGFLGKNGSGKSSLFKAIVGELSLLAGDIYYPKNTTIGWIKQEVPGEDINAIDVLLAADTERTHLLNKLENCSDEEIAPIYERLQDIDAYSAPSRAQTILYGLGFDEAAQHEPLKNFSGGIRMRIALAACLFLKPQILLLDEPSNYLDIEGVMWLENYIKQLNATIILISHDKNLLTNCTNHILNLEHKKLSLWSGNYENYLKLRAEKLKFDEQQIKSQNAKRKKIESFIERFRYKASKAKQAQSRIKALEKLQEFEIYKNEHSAPFFFQGPDKNLTSPLITLEKIKLGYGDKIILSDIICRIDKDDRIALLGKNGNGKSTFAKFLAQKLTAISGERIQNNKLSIAYFEQHHVKALDLEKNALEHIQAKLPTLAESKTRALLAQWGLDSEKIATKTINLSGGEKTRLAMALATLKPTDLLILDEPTNHLDIDSRQELIFALNNFSGAIILISHDQYLLEATIDKFWQVKNGTITAYEFALNNYKQEILKLEAKPKKSNKRAILKEDIKQLEKKINKLQKERSETTNQYIIAQLDKKIAEAENLWLSYNEEYDKNYKIKNK